MAERLSRAYGELTQAARRFLAETRVVGYLGERQVERLQAQAAEQLEALQRAFRLQDAQVPPSPIPLRLSDLVNTLAGLVALDCSLVDRIFTHAGEAVRRQKTDKFEKRASHGLWRR